MTTLGDTVVLVRGTRRRADAARRHLDLDGPRERRFAWGLDEDDRYDAARVARGNACMATLGSKAVLFSAEASATRVEWDGSSWVEVATSGPTARYGAACATLNGRLVLSRWRLGRGSLDDTWEWDGKTWTQLSVGSVRPRSARRAAPPGPRFFSSVERAGSLRLGDTWTWDGTRWTTFSLSTAPTSRSGAAIALLFPLPPPCNGGLDADVSDSRADTDTQIPRANAAH